MRHFIIETRHDTGRKLFMGLSVREKYVAERELAKRTARPGRTLAIESFPSVADAEAAIAAHNEPLPFTAPKATPSSPILNAAQAEAVYSAMCALNNVGAAAWCRMPVEHGVEWVDVRQDDVGGIHILKGPLRRFDPAESIVTSSGKVERYFDQNAFATAYGLNTDA